MLGPGTLYGILTRMHTEGYIRLESAEGRRKVYAITEAGAKALLEEYRRLKTMVQDGNILEEELKETAVRTASDGICHRGNRTVLF